MASKYYYLISSLPYLKIDNKLLITSDSFLGECSKWLALPDLALLSKIDLNDFHPSQDDPPVLGAWKEFDLQLRTDLAVARGQKQSAYNEKPPSSVSSILSQENPLLMERELLRIRWSLLDELESGNYFDLNVLILYYLKLQILERLATFDKEKGQKRLDEICEVTYA